MTELAVIAPIHALSPVTQLKYQWALTSKLDNERYKAFFLHMSDCDKHVTLMQDDRIKPFLLAQYAEDIGAREIILPFAVNQYYETVERVNETLRGMAVDRDSAEILRGLRPHIMIVPQGEDLYTMVKCVRDSLSRYERVATQNPALFPFLPSLALQATRLAQFSADELMHLKAVLNYYKDRHIQFHLLEWNTLTTFGISFRSVSTMVPYIRASGLLFNITPRFLDRKFTSGEMDNVSLFIRQLRKRV